MTRFAAISVPVADDAAFVREAATDPARFGTLYRLYVDDLYRYLLARCGDETNAEDLVAETFLAAFRAARGYRGTGPVKAWLVGIARRKAADAHRGKRAHLALDAAIELADPIRTDDLALQRVELARVVAMTMRLAPDRAEALAASVLRRPDVRRDRPIDGPQRICREDACPPRAQRSPRAIGGNKMTDDERFAKEVRGLALSIRTPETVSIALDRAAAEAVAHRTSRYSLRSRHALAAAAIVAVVVLAASLVIATAPASASDLLVRAERAAVNGSASLNTYRGTTKGENWMGPDGKRVAVPASYEQKIEFSSPNSVRIDTTATDPSGTTGRQQLFFDGKAAWIYVPDAKVAQPIDPRMVLSQSPFAPSTLAGAIEGLSQVFNAKQLSEDAVLGRRAYVLELTPKDPAQSGPMAKITTWLDAETLLQLGADVRDAQGQLLMTWRFVALDLNVDIAASDFTFTPSADVRIGQVLPPGATTAMRMQLWSQLATQSSFQLFRPFCGIDGLDEGMPSSDQRGVVFVPFTANGSVVVVMQQGPRDAFPSDSGENVTIGDITAIYRVADGTEHLDFERSGTHVHIQAPQPLGRDPLYHLAVSLVPVAKS